MTRKLHVQIPGAFLRCIINSAVQHLRTVLVLYSATTVLYALHESVLKRIHVAAGVTRHLHDSLGRRGFFKMQAF